MPSQALLSNDELRRFYRDYLQLRRSPTGRVLPDGSMQALADHWHLSLTQVNELVKKSRKQLAKAIVDHRAILNEQEA